MSLETVEVSSAVFVTIGYDAEARELHLNFLDGGLYVYPDVGPEIWAGIQGEMPYGQFFNQYIRPTCTVFEHS